MAGMDRARPVGPGSLGRCCGWCNAAILNSSGADGTLLTRSGVSESMRNQGYGIGRGNLAYCLRIRIRDKSMKKVFKEVCNSENSNSS